ncbi:MAG: zinc-binding dehydrogenase [Chloroflexi bacterium]|nr:zinc-binding dehydrogenase [Chloroflexota bacterium]
MRAVLVYTSDTGRRFQIEEIPTPAPRPDQLLVRVEATSINFADLSYGIGRPPPANEPFVPGLDVAGTVEAVGPHVTGWKKGDPVVALASRGAYAEFVPARPVLACSPPKGMSMQEVASVPCVFLTAWFGLTKFAGTKPGETVLIHAGGSGVGVAGIQIARALGARVITSAGSDAKLAKAKELGAEAGVNYTTQDLTAELQRLTEGRGVDVVLDPVGGPIFDATLPALATGGRVVTAGGPAGARSDLDQAALDARGQRVLQVGVFNDAAEDTDQSGWTQLKAWFEDGTLRPVVDRVLPWTQAEAAQRLLAERAVFGKVVLTVGD